MLRRYLLFSCLTLTCGCGALAQGVPKVVPVPPLRPQVAAKEPTTPPARDVEVARDHLSFHLPPGWNLSAHDGEISSFRQDAPNALRRSQLRMVASLNFNPFPSSTFEGALFYLSGMEGVSNGICTSQTTLPPAKELPPVDISGTTFARGRQEQGKICTESRDVIYAASHAGSCLRFDLVIHNFCGGEVSGAQDLSEAQLGSLFSRLDGILKSVRFEHSPKAKE